MKLFFLSLPKPDLIRHSTVWFSSLGQRRWDTAELSSSRFISWLKAACMRNSHPNRKEMCVRVCQWGRGLSFWLTKGIPCWSDSVNLIKRPKKQCFKCKWTFSHRCLRNECLSTAFIPYTEYRKVGPLMQVCVRKGELNGKNLSQETEVPTCKAKKERHAQSWVIGLKKQVFYSSH